jgi:hypothetical protein
MTTGGADAGDAPVSARVESAAFREFGSSRWLAPVFTLYALAMLLFALVHPVLEWPDAEVHLTKACQGETWFPPREILAALGQDVCAFSYASRAGEEEFRFFADKSLNSDLQSINSIWAYILFPLAALVALFVLLAFSGNRDAVGNPLVFAPPLAFYFANVNAEVFGLFLVVGAYFIFRTRPRIALLLTVAATLIDRSHVCSVFTLGLLYFFRTPARAALLPYFMGVVLVLYVARLTGFLAVLDWISAAFESITVLGVSGRDILYQAELGGRGYAALPASAAGLYGAMSYRPVLWLAYYAVFFVLFGIGYLQSDRAERKVLFISIAAALCVLIILPPLSQARYYPILMISMWSMAIKGGRWFGISALPLQALFFCWTALSLTAANLNHIADA